jgi:hypothetical protein
VVRNYRLDHLPFGMAIQKNDGSSSFHISPFSACLSLAGPDLATAARYRHRHISKKG